MSSGDIGVIVAGAVGPFGGVQPAKARRAFGITTKDQKGIVAQITVEERHTDEMQITDHPVEQGAMISDHAFMRPYEVTIRCAWSASTMAQSNSITGGIGGIVGNIASALGNAAAGSVQAQLSSAGARAIGGSAIGNLAVGQLSDIFGKSIVSIGASLNSGNGRGTSLMQDVYQQLQDLQSSRVPFTIYTGKRKYDSMLIKSMTVETDIKTENSLQVVLVCRQVIIAQVVVSSIVASSDDQATPETTATPVETGTKQALPVTPDPGSPLQTGIEDFVEPFSKPWNEELEGPTVSP